MQKIGMCYNILMKKILIIGGGFGGIKAALGLARARLHDVEITLVSDRPHFEYYPSLYRIVTGVSPMEICVPLETIFRGTGVHVVQDEIVEIDPVRRTLVGASDSAYHADYLIVAVGSVPAFFGIPGLAELSFTCKSINDALRLKRHLHNALSTCVAASRVQMQCAATITVIGGGPSGVELAGSLAEYARAVAHNHGVDPSIINIELFEAAPRILPSFPAVLSRRVEQRLRMLGVNIHANRPILGEDVAAVHAQDLDLKTSTVIWDAGTQSHPLIRNTKGFILDKNGRVRVNEYLEAAGCARVYVIGDCAETTYSGSAQTALRDAAFVAANIGALLHGRVPARYRPQRPLFVAPVGRYWAAAQIHGMVGYGRLMWILRRAADFRFFASILPLPHAISLFRNGRSICESCAICMPHEKEYAV